MVIFCRQLLCGVNVIGRYLQNQPQAGESWGDFSRASSILVTPVVIICYIIVYTILHGSVAQGVLMTWTLVQISIAVSRMIFLQYFRRMHDRPVIRKIRLGFFLFTGLMWAVPFVFFLREGDVLEASLLTLIVIGVASGSMLTHLDDLKGAFAVSIPAMAGVEYHLLSAGDSKLSLLAILALLFFSMVAIASMRLRFFFVENRKNQKSLQRKNEEITEKNARLYRLAHFDDLTGAANRCLLVEHGNAYLASAVRKGQLSAFFHIDLDHFKHLNDTLGHAAGDELLRLVTKELRATVRLDDVVARLGGDEFGILVKGLDGKKDAEMIAQKIMGRLEQTQNVMGTALQCRASIGIAFSPQHGVSISELMKNSDLALQQAKRLGRGKYRFCSSELQSKARRMREVEKELRAALAANAVCYHFQPIVEVQSGLVTGAEALMRVEGSTPCSATAEELIDAAETVGAMDALGAQLFASLEERGRELFRRVPSLRKLSLNLSPAELRSQTPVGRIKDLLDRKAFRPDQLQVEITEQSVLERGSDKAMQAIEQVFEMGVSIVMDDFGTGYSSLTHLKMLPISGVKIDKSFVQELNSDMRDAAIVRSLVGMCKGLGLTVTAEGVEHLAQLETLRRLGCDLVQGHLFYKAAGVDALESRIDQTGERFRSGFAGLHLGDVEQQPAPKQEQEIPKQAQETLAAPHEQAQKANLYKG